MPVAVITGASKGFGRAVAEALVAKKWAVVNGSRSAAEIPGVEFIKTDVTNGSDCEQLIQQVVERHGTIDLFVANAGILVPGTIEQFQQSAWEEVLATNVVGMACSVAAAYRQLAAQRSGTLLIIASTSAVNFSSKELAYTASKWATLGFAGCVRTAAEGSGVRVLCFCPGGMKTELFRRINRDTSRYMDPAAVAQLLVRIIEEPAGKDWLFVLPRDEPLQRYAFRQSILEHS